MLRFKAAGVAVLPAGVGGLVSHHLWDNRLFRLAGGSNQEPRLIPHRCVSPKIPPKVFSVRFPSLFIFYLFSAAFTFHQFNQFLKSVTIPCVWIGVLSLTWEMVAAMFRCACVSGFLRRFWRTIQWTLVAAATASVFSISLVSFQPIKSVSELNQRSLLIKLRPPGAVHLH